MLTELTELCDTNERHAFKKNLKPAPELSDDEGILYATHLVQICVCNPSIESLHNILRQTSASSRSHLGHMQCLQLLKNVSSTQAQTTDLGLGQQIIFKLLCNYIYTNLYPTRHWSMSPVMGQRFFDNKENSLAYDDLKYGSVADNVCRQIFDIKQFSFLTKDLSNCRITKVFIEKIIESAQQQMLAARSTQPAASTSNEEGEEPSYYCSATVCQTLRN